MYLVLKRAMDIVLSSVALVILTPIMIPVLVILRFTGEGKVFFLQERVGLRQKSFQLVKLVTMRLDSPKSGTITIKDDPRVLPFGRFLRKTKINELPQLLNILVGQMSIVGPRPLTREAVDFYPEEMKSRIYQSKPGLTGVGSIAFRDEETIISNSKKDCYQCYREDIMPVKGALELWYAGNRSFWIDLKIILLTAIKIIRPGNRLYARWLNGIPIFYDPGYLSR